MTEKQEMQEVPVEGNGAPNDRTSEQVVDESEPVSGLESLRSDLEDANQKLQEYLALAQRTQADFVNYRKRIEADRGESIAAGKAALAVRLLPAIDDFDLALGSVSATESETDFVKGIRLIQRKLYTALELEGIVRIESLGQEFTPYEHEAMMQVPSTAEESGKVVGVYRFGYKQGDKILRPAQVIVGKGTD